MVIRHLVLVTDGPFTCTISVQIVEPSECQNGDHLSTDPNDFKVYQNIGESVLRMTRYGGPGDSG